jgi:anaerobic ribonucleoside-triphosphate reductase activating protein
MLPFGGGTVTRVGQLLESVDASQENGVEGVTLLGGEPFAQAAAAAALAAGVQRLGLTVMVFSGYTIDQLRGFRDPAIRRLLGHSDVLVDGPFLRESAETTRRWIGSSNQQVHFLTDHYDPNDPCWRVRNTVEIRLRGNELSVNGFPAPRGKLLWKNLRPMALRECRASR